MPLSAFIISSESEKSFSFAVKKGCGRAASGKHPAPSESEERCFMQAVPCMKMNTANEKDPSTALGMTIRDNAHPARLSSRCDANLRPFGGHLLPREGGRMPLHGLLMKMGYDTRIPFPHIRHFERKREIFFVRGKAKAVRGAASGAPLLPAPRKNGVSCRPSTQEKEHGKRKRSLGCARDDDTRIPLSRTTFIPLRCQPPPLRGTSFQGKEGECRFTSASYRWLTIRECRSPAFVAHTRFFIGL